jgi:hypothetical protein
MRFKCWNQHIGQAGLRKGSEHRAQNVIIKHDDLGQQLSGRERVSLLRLTLSWLGSRENNA